MPYVYKHRRPPGPWHEFRRRALHRAFIPLYYANWVGDWSVYYLGKWSIFEILEYVGSFSILIAVVFYFLDAPDRLKQKHYQAWQVINTAQGKGGSGGRIDALQELNEDHVPLVGVDVSDAYLQDLHLVKADLRRADLRGADARRAVLVGSDLEGATLRSTNLRGADLSRARLLDANFTDSDLAGANLSKASLKNAIFNQADLRGADLANVRDWKSIRSLRLANIHGLRNAPDGFIAFAKAAGAVDADGDDAWESLVNAATASTAH
jgi:hypothetical protein